MCVSVTVIWMNIVNLFSDHNRGGRQKVGAIIVAAGKSIRMMGRDKIFHSLLGKPVIAYTVTPFERCLAVSEIVLVTHETSVEDCLKTIEHEGWTKVVGVCEGGDMRQDSVRAGLGSLSSCEWVIIHDGARPCVTEDMIELALEEARFTGVSVPALPVTDTVKRVEDGFVLETIQRDDLRTIQTPQVFRSGIISEAYAGDIYGVTDDSSLVERLGYSVRIFQGSEENIKITTPKDLDVAEAILRRRLGS